MTLVSGNNEGHFQCNKNYLYFAELFIDKKYIAYIIIIIQDQAVYQIGILSLCYPHKENEESKKYKYATRNANQD